MDSQVMAGKLRRGDITSSCQDPAFFAELIHDSLYFRPWNSLPSSSLAEFFSSNPTSDLVETSLEAR